MHLKMSYYRIIPFKVNTLTLEKFASALSALWNAQVCPTFSVFKFNDELNTDMELYEIQDYMAEPIPLDTQSDGDRSCGFDYDNDYDDGPHDFEPVDILAPVARMESSADLVRLVPVVTENETDLGDLFSYFDKSMNKAWAGPDFWRSRTTKTFAAPKPTAPRKKAKLVTAFNFEESVKTSALFKKATTTINLPKPVLQTDCDNLLPPDYQINSKSFAKLFMKPNAAYKIGRVITRSSQDDQGCWFNVENVEIFEADPQTYPDMPVEHEYDFDDVYDHDPDPEPVQNDFPISDYLSNPQDAMEQVVIHQSVKAEPLSYSKKAKRVDVQKLKENLWTGLEQEKEVFVLI